MTTIHKHEWGDVMAELPPAHNVRPEAPPSILPRPVKMCRGCDALLVGTRIYHTGGGPIVDLLMVDPPKSTNGYPLTSVRIGVAFEPTPECHESFGWTVHWLDPASAYVGHRGPEWKRIAAGRNLEQVCAEAREFIEREAAESEMKCTTDAAADALAEEEVPKPLRVGDDADDLLGRLAKSFDPDRPGGPGRDGEADDGE